MLVLVLRGSSRRRLFLRLEKPISVVDSAFYAKFADRTRSALGDVPGF